VPHRFRGRTSLPPLRVAPTRHSRPTIGPTWHRRKALSRVEGVCDHGSLEPHSPPPTKAGDRNRLRNRGGGGRSLVAVARPRRRRHHCRPGIRTTRNASTSGSGGRPPATRGRGVGVRVAGRRVRRCLVFSPIPATKPLAKVRGPQFEMKIDSISVFTCSSVWARAIAISFTIKPRAVSSMRRSPNDSCLSVFSRYRSRRTSATS